VYKELWYYCAIFSLSFTVQYFPCLRRLRRGLFRKLYIDIDTQSRSLTVSYYIYLTQILSLLTLSQE